MTFAAMTAQSKQAAAAGAPEDFRMYEKLWRSIIHPDASGKQVRVTCHPSNATRIKMAIRKEKCAANNLRKGLSMPQYGRLNTSVKLLPNGKAEITFTLQFNGDML